MLFSFMKKRAIYHRISDREKGWEQESGEGRGGWGVHCSPSLSSIILDEQQHSENNHQKQYREHRGAGFICLVTSKIAGGFAYFEVSTQLKTP